MVKKIKRDERSDAPPHTCLFPFRLSSRRDVSFRRHGTQVARLYYGHAARLVQIRLRLTVTAHLSFFIFFCSQKFGEELVRMHPGGMEDVVVVHTSTPAFEKRHHVFFDESSQPNERHKLVAFVN